MSYLIKYNFLIDVLKTIFNKQQYYDAMQNFNDFIKLANLIIYRRKFDFS